ncbi:ZIP family metal transporter [Psychroflexus gondwanensis]|jgi:zinc transporter ZupT|uniref:Zinc transporter, ZIP family protein n=1 Tax=Psychroflexus gondwanensis ACAM 44 TaxID=1189619 RepID=N1X2C3_9FLAO|nr:ZIP family metal transporter [Psychroflexus gondwanensis]EMY82218.1 zinc transporter, ZIP family protein [Psychroflexus gondwanensis ACAM 44]TXE17395.1 ZIP family metal transporter [Psychroflexus gondwanensis]
MNLLLPILAVLIGFGISYFLYEKFVIINLLLAFSGSFLLSVTVLEFLPGIYNSDVDSIGVFILGGILLQIMLEYMSGGAEHGHLHISKENTSFPWVLFISLCIHAFLEGVPIHGNDHLLYAVIIHKVPIAIIISSFLFNTSLSKAKVIFFLLIFGIMTPFGSFVQANTTLFDDIGVYLNAIVIGIFLHVSTTILFESSRDHKFNIYKFGIIVLGIVLALVL